MIISYYFNVPKLKRKQPPIIPQNIYASVLLCRLVLLGGISACSTLLLGLSLLEGISDCSTSLLGLFLLGDISICSEFLLGLLSIPPSKDSDTGGGWFRQQFEDSDIPSPQILDNSIGLVKKYRCCTCFTVPCFSHD